MRIDQLKLKPGESIELLPKKIENKTGTKVNNWHIVKESIDARNKKNIFLVYSVEYNVSSPEPEIYLPFCNSQISLPFHSPVIVGFGPAGLFAGLILARAGAKPVIFERGSDVDTRTAQVKEFWETGKLDTNSNVQFGEGGAGTFSDGKLTTGIKDPSVRFVFTEFVKHGGPSEILYLSKPHIGTDILRNVVRSIRNEIISLGGTVNFNSNVTGMIIEDGSVAGVKLNDREFLTDNVIFAIGHSSRDTLRWLKDYGILMNRKPFSIGVRIEHPQDTIDIAQYGSPAWKLGLRVADYKLSYHTSLDRGVYTFCMCPGGHVVCASSQEGGVVTNGMSYHNRDSGFANSAMLVDVKPDDFEGEDVLSGMYFQEKYEHIAYINGMKQSGIPYGIPKATWGELRDGKAPLVQECLPDFAINAMREAMPVFGKKIHGFDNDESLIYAVEARSSSPVRFLRNEAYFGSIKKTDSDESVVLKGFYPCGEGAGYAGGIVSAACDGIRIAKSILTSQDSCRP